ncbi:ATPase AAA-type core [Penicillium herquei]|nr:ATPase AAA-type core [Penicillium herquei]
MDSQKRKQMTPEAESESGSAIVPPLAKRGGLRPALPFETCIIHRTHCSQQKDHQNHNSIAYFEDVPRLFAGDSKASTLRGKKQIVDPSDLVESHPEIALIIYREYDCNEYHRRVERSFKPLERPTDPPLRLLLPYFYRLDEDGPPAISNQEAMLVSSGELQYALVELTGMDYGAISQLETAETVRRLVTRIYHLRDAHNNASLRQRMDEKSFKLALGFVDFMQGIFDQEYSEADSLFSRGLVTLFHLPKLFADEEVLFTHEQDNPMAYVLAEFPKEPTALPCWAWRFDGRFWRHRTVFNIIWPKFQETTAITDLSIYPLRYASQDAQKSLRNRGKQFWSIRLGSYISCTKAASLRDNQHVQPRYMVDMVTYKQLHSGSEESDEREYLSDATMNSDNPPDGNLLLLLPATVHGFGFQDKKWRLLSVSQICPIEWNEQAFEHLVLNSTKKELIQALVKKHDSMGKSTDFIEGKGNGLILLLHGGPGTGKTLTAESVAELTSRPLYRVTCGDVGTNADDVEEYLESALHLGKIWRCVVLLDEADVFLEERTHQDLQRNALVSVFLRVIEYYDGILVLTSNRIGTFDEAFKSRVQLIVHYPKLEKDDRRRVWFKFFINLRKTRSDSGMDELEERLEELSAIELNGREIRNSIQTATLLAEFKGGPMRYEHLMKVIGVTSEFKNYLKDGCGDDEERLRLRQIRP